MVGPGVVKTGQSLSFGHVKCFMERGSGAAQQSFSIRHRSGLVVAHDRVQKQVKV